MPTLEIKLLQDGKSIEGITDLDVLKDINTSERDLGNRFSGLLCVYHASVPSVQKLFKDGHWHMEITTCCLPLLLEVKRRLEQ